MEKEILSRVIFPESNDFLVTKSKKSKNKMKEDILSLEEGSIFFVREKKRSFEQYAIATKLSNSLKLLYQNGNKKEIPLESIDYSQLNFQITPQSKNVQLSLNKLPNSNSLQIGSKIESISSLKILINSENSKSAIISVESTDHNVFISCNGLKDLNCEQTKTFYFDSIDEICMINLEISQENELFVQISQEGSPVHCTRYDITSFLKTKQENLIDKKMVLNLRNTVKKLAENLYLYAENGKNFKHL